MNEADVRLKFYRRYREQGLWPITNTDAVKCSCGRMYYPKKGRPDILVLNPLGRSLVCEVKVLRAGETSFSTDKIEEEQRRWLTRWMESGGLGYIGLGIIRQHGKRQFCDYLYHIPWGFWLHAEGLVTPIQGAIPLVAGPGYNRELQDNNYDIIHLFKTWRVE